jgi:hypothetical protein
MRALQLLAAAALAAASGTAARGGGIPPVAVTPVAEGFIAPVCVAHAPADATRLFILEKAGRIRILNLDTLVVNPAAFLNIQPLVQLGSEQGLLGLAFHPDYQANGRFFIYYVGRTQPGETVIAEYHRSADPDTAETTGDIIHGAPQLRAPGRVDGLRPRRLPLHRQR